MLGVLTHPRRKPPQPMSTACDNEPKQLGLGVSPTVLWNLIDYDAWPAGLGSKGAGVGLHGFENTGFCCLCWDVVQLVLCELRNHFMLQQPQTCNPALLQGDASPHLQEASIVKDY